MVVKQLQRDSPMSMYCYCKKKRVQLHRPL